MSTNPYAVSDSGVDLGVDNTTQLEAMRQEYIKHEASIKSIGVLYFIAAVLFGFVGATSFSTGKEGLMPALIGCAVCALYLWLGISVQRLKRGSKVGVGILSGLGLLAIPVGTLINAYILWLVFSAKGKTIFSDEYKEVIAATPHIKYKSSKIVVGFLIVIVIIFAALVLPALMR
jgi:hypothetical protein